MGGETIADFSGQAGVIGGFATSLCLLLLIGVVMADRPDGSAAAGDITGGQTMTGDSALASAAPLLAAGTSSGITISTNSPIHSLQPELTVFGGQENPLFQRASFVSPGQ